MTKDDEPWAWLDVEKRDSRASTVRDEDKNRPGLVKLLEERISGPPVHRLTIGMLLPEYDPGAPIILDREQDRITVDLLAHLEEGGTLQEFCEARGELRYPTEHEYKPYQLTLRRYRQWAANFYQCAYDEIPINDPLPWYKPITIEPDPPWTPPEEIEGVCYQGHQLETRNRDGHAVCINGHEA